MRVKWECWIVIKNAYTGNLESQGPYIAVTTGEENDLDVLSSLHNRILSEPDDGTDNYLLEFKTRDVS